jgi:hypothetical protein
MQALFFGLALLGSCSLGYSLLRTGFPEKQDSTQIEKLSYGYGLGILIFIPGMATALLVNEQFFFLVTAIFYAMLFAAFFIKRKYNKETDTTELIVEKFVSKIPTKVLTDEEKIKKETKLADDEEFGPEPDLIPKRKISSDEKITIINPINTKEQLFKEGKTNVIEKLREKTLSANDLESNKKRAAALNKLKGFAKEMEDDEDE